LTRAGQCRLKFAEGSIDYEIEFDVESLDADDPLFAANYWHHHLFKPALPGQVRVLAFTPRL